MELECTGRWRRGYDAMIAKGGCCVVELGPHALALRVCPAALLARVPLDHIRTFAPPTPDPLPLPPLLQG